MGPSTNIVSGLQDDKVQIVAAQDLGRSETSPTGSNDNGIENLCGKAGKSSLVVWSWIGGIRKGAIGQGRIEQVEERPSLCIDFRGFLSVERPATLC